MKKFTLIIITPQGEAFNDKVESIVAPGMDGLFGIMANHRPFVATLKTGFLKIGHEGDEQFFAIETGIIEVKHDSSVLILADDVLPAKDKEEAKEKIKDLQTVV